MDTGIYIPYEESSLAFANAGTEVMKFCPNGDIYVRGKLVTNDMEVVQEAFAFFKKANGK